MIINCENCGEDIEQMDEPSFIYPCHKCGLELEMGSESKPLTALQWLAVQRRWIGDLARKLEKHSDLVKIGEITDTLSNMLIKENDEN